MKIFDWNTQKNKTRQTHIRGFMTVILVISFILVTMLASLGAFAVAESYDDSVSRREHRMRAGIDASSCVSVALLAFAHDYFYTAKNQAVTYFSCSIVSAVRSGSVISIAASGYDGGITESISARAEDNGRSITTDE